VLGALADEIQILHDNGTSGLTATTLKAAIEELVVDIAAEETARIAADALLLTDPLTTKGDIVIQDTSVAARLAKGTEGQYLVMGGSDLPVWGDGLVINEAGIDVDFRVESDTDTHALFVQGSDGKVGIGDSAPFGKLHVKTGHSGGGAHASGDELVLESDGNAGLTISTPDTAIAYIMYADASRPEGAYHAYYHATDTYYFILDGNVHHLISAATTVINDSGVDHDFRVESDTNTHAFFLDGSADSISAQVSGGVTIKEGNVFDYTALTLENSGTAPSASHKAELHFDVNGSGGNATRAKIRGGKTDSGSTNGSLLFDLLDAGVSEERLSLLPTEAVFNDPGNDVDFRVESDTETHALFVRGSDGRVALGGGVYGTQNTHEIVINDTTAFATSITGGSGFYPQSSDTLAIGNDDITTNSGYTSLHMVRFGSGGAAAAKIALSNRSAGNGRLSFMLRDSAHTATIDEKMHIDNFGVMINPLGTDRDLQVQSDTDTHALFVRGSDGEVGIGESAPLAKLHVKTGHSGGSVHSNADDFAIESDGNAGLTISTPDTATAFIVYGDASGSTPAYHRYAHATDTYGFVIASNELHSISATGTVINGSNIDHDFRVASDTKTFALFVQGSDGNVGIGQSAPAVDLTVGSYNTLITSEGPIASFFKGNDTSVDILSAANNTGQGPRLRLLEYSAAKYGGELFYDSGTNDFMLSQYANDFENTRLSIRSTEIVANDPGLDRDFRVESDTNTHALFLEGSSGHIGIGTSTPLSPLEIKIATGDSGGSSGIRMTTVDGGGMSLYPATAVANPVWTFSANSGETFAWRPHGAACMALDYGLTLGAPTGGQKGTGTLNAVNVYDDNTLLTDFVLDQAVDGEIDFEFYDNLELGGAAAREWDPRNLDIDHYEEKWKERKALPSFRSREERFDDDGNEIRDSLGTLVQGLQQELETAMVHIAQLNARLKQLEEQ
jgi:hypothetical protein